MSEASQARCDLCGDALDGGRALCVDCSRRALRARKTALRQSYLAAAGADERAAAALAGLAASPGYEHAATLADLRARLVATRARTAALQEHIDALRERSAKERALVRKREAFLRQRKDSLAATQAALKASQFVLLCLCMCS